MKFSLKKNNRVFFGFPIYILLFIILSSLFKFFLLNGQHIFAFGNSIHDDRLFIDIAKNLLRLDWLGNYNNLTLAKGVGYPLWIALNNILGIPLLFAQNLLYTLACLTLIIALKPLFSKQHYWLIVIYLILLFSPSSFSNDTMRVLRESIYPSLSLFIVAFSIGILIRKNKPINNIIIWIIGLSISFSYFWITREEGIWIMPYLFSILLFIAYELWKKKGKQWKDKLLLLLTPFVFLIIFNLTISSINYLKYGIFTTVEFKDKVFLEAYGSLTRVKDKERKQFVPVSKEKIKRIYEVSPSFKKLELFLSGDLGKNWAKHSTVFENKESGEMEGGWFMWAFRDAVAAAGYYKTGSVAFGYYRQLSIEVDNACKEKKLDCFEKRKTIIAPFYKEQIIPTLNSAIRVIKYLAGFEESKLNRVASVGDKNSLNLFSKMTHESVYDVGDTQNDTLEIRGWAFSPSEKIILSIVDNKDEIKDYNITNNNGMDIYEFYSKQGRFFENAKKSRFLISTSCLNNCFLLVRGRNFSEKISLDTNASSSNKNSMILVHIDSSEIKKTNNSRDVIDKIDDLKLFILNSIGDLYRLFMSFCMILSFLIFVLSTFIQKKRQSIFYLINLFLLFSIFARIIILSVIDATSFPSVNAKYLSPLYPMIIIFILFNLFSLKSFLIKSNKKME